MITYRKYMQAKQKVSEILAQHTLQVIRHNRNLYQNGAQQYSNFNNLYLQYGRLVKTINEYESTICQRGCANCMRRYLPLIETRKRSLKKRKQFKHIIQNAHRGTDVLKLCSECKDYLTTETTSPDVAWPSYIWYLLQNEDIHSVYGDHIWKFIPKIWRKWWIEPCKSIYNHVYASITEDKPEPVFIDKTKNAERWNSKISTYNLRDLATICSEMLQPTIKCPYGCTEFQHKTGTLPLDVIYQRFLQHVNLKTMTPLPDNAHKLVQSAREDYLSLDGYIELWLFNIKWRIMPTITIEPGKGPCVSTCRYHDKGIKKFMVHQNRWKHNLPSRMSDQLCQAVINPRQLKPMRASKYSDSYQMYQQTGSFNGIDTCTNSIVGKFDFRSLLSKEAEARSLYNRHDINVHLSILVNEGKISDFAAASKRNHAIEFSKTIDYTNYTYGSTYVPLEAAMSLQKEMSDRTIEALEHDPEKLVTFKKYWPSSLYPCQTMTAHGVIFPQLPPLKSNSIKTKNVWILCTMMTRVEYLWTLLDVESYSTLDWEGWMMAYLTKYCFNESDRRQSPIDPFKLSQMKTIDDFVSKIKYLPLDSYFERHYKIHYHNFTSQQQITQLALDNDDEETEVLILDNVPQNEIMKYRQLNGKYYELQTIVGTKQNDNIKWDGFTYSKHRGQPFYSWWYNKRMQHIPIKVYDIPPILDPTYAYTLIYIIHKSVDVNTIHNEFMKHLGGQVHVQCKIHRCPLIRSSEKKNRCSCGKKEYLKCCELDCSVNICKPCLKEKSEDTITFIPPTLIPVEMNHASEDSDSGEDDEPTIAGEGTEEVEDNFDDFFTHSIEDDLNLANHEDEQIYGPNIIPTTHAGAEPLEINSETVYGGTSGRYIISGHVMLNQCGTLLTRKKHQIKGNPTQQHVLQKIHSSLRGISVPLMYPGGTTLPSIHYKIAQDNCAIAGCLPAPLWTNDTTTSRFESIGSHIRSRLTNASSTTSSDPRFICQCYDVLTNLTATHSDTRVILNRGLTVDDEEEICVRGKGDTALLPSNDSKKVVRNLCTSQKFHKWDHFVTLTDNMRTHFGTAPIKQWIDGDEWKNHYPGFYDLADDEQEEITRALHQAAAPLLLRVWEETYLLLVEYLRKSESSPFKRQRSIFSRKEYQKDRGNLSHAHVINELDWEKMTEKEKEFVDDLIRASVFEIVRSDEIEWLVEEGVLESADDVERVIEDGETFLAHICNDLCLVRRPDGTLRCKKLNNVNVSKDNTKHTFMKLPNNYSIPCLKILEKIGLTDELEIDEDGNVLNFKAKLKFFHPERHIPPTNPTNDKNISPVVGYLFAVCRSMQNVQRLVGTGGCAKYICKYIAKLDEQNYVVIEVDGKSSLVTKAYYLHNTKVSSSKMGEDKRREKHSHYHQGRCISLFEMLHIMLKYPEVVTDVEFKDIPTMPLEMRPGIKLDSDVEKRNDSEQRGGDYQTTTMNSIREDVLELDHSRCHTDNQKLILDDLKLSKISVDKVTQFSLRPPEFLKVFDQLGNYFRWFYIDEKKMKKDDVLKKLTESLDESCWIDGLQRQVRVRRKALKEIKLWCDTIVKDDGIDLEDLNDIRVQIIKLFNRIYDVIEEGNVGSDTDFKEHVMNNLLYVEKDDRHLPVPVFSYINPNMGTQFIHHIMLSLGRFETEVDINLQPSIRKALEYCKLIGSNEDEESLEIYTYKLMKLYIVEQLQYFPNAQRVLDAWIITAFEYMMSVIVHDEVPMSEMPPVLLSNLHSATEEDVKQHTLKLKKSLIEAALKEIGPNTERYNIPSKEAIINNPPNNDMEWDALANLHQTSQQSTESYSEQKIALHECFKAIDSYSDLSKTTYTKNLGIRGFPGAGKTWCMMYAIIYALSKGLRCTTTAMMCNRALQLGGIHIHQLMLLPTEENVSGHRKAELSIVKLLKTPAKLSYLKEIDVIFFDEMGQVSAELLNTFDMILREIRGTNVYMGGVLLIFTMDHTQIQPITGRPFLTSCNMVSCFRMVALETSVRASNDENFKRIQQIARYNYKKLQSNPELITEFKRLCSETLTFVDSWEDEKIKPDTMRLYSKKVPAREASQLFVQKVKDIFEQHELRVRIADDVQKSRYSHRDWSQASPNTSAQLEQRLKEPKELLFFKYAVYEITYNEKDKFSHGQIAVLFDLPSEESLQQWKKVKVLIAPPGIKDFDFSTLLTKEDFYRKGFVESEIGQPPQRSQYLSNDVQAQRKQYGLRHRVSSTIHAAMGDTLASMATAISKLIADFKLWDKGQLIVILSRTRLGKDSIFVGNKLETIEALVHLLTKKTQWTDYMEEVLELITLNNPEENNSVPQQRILTQNSFPYRICDVTLPQCNTGYVYMIVSLRDKSFTNTHIKKTNSLRDAINYHNRGLGGNDMEPPHLRPYALFAFICGFDNNYDLMEYVAEEWKKRQYDLAMSGNNNVLDWAICGSDAARTVTDSPYEASISELTFVSLFQSKEN